MFSIALVLLICGLAGAPAASGTTASLSEFDPPPAYEAKNLSLERQQYIPQCISHIVLRNPPHAVGWGQCRSKFSAAWPGMCASLSSGRRLVRLRATVTLRDICGGGEVQDTFAGQPDQIYLALDRALSRVGFVRAHHHIVPRKCMRALVLEERLADQYGINKVGDLRIQFDADSWMCRSAAASLRGSPNVVRKLPAARAAMDAAYRDRDDGTWVNIGSTLIFPARLLQAVHFSQPRGRSADAANTTILLYSSGTDDPDDHTNDDNSMERLSISAQLVSDKAMRFITAAQRRLLSYFGLVVFEDMILRLSSVQRASIFALVPRIKVYDICFQIMPPNSAGEEETTMQPRVLESLQMQLEQPPTRELLQSPTRESLQLEQSPTVETPTSQPAAWELPVESHAQGAMQRQTLCTQRGMMMVSTYARALQRLEAFTALSAGRFLRFLSVSVPRGRPLVAYRGGVRNRTIVHYASGGKRESHFGVDPIGQADFSREVERVTRVYPETVRAGCCLLLVARCVRDFRVVPRGEHFAVSAIYDEEICGGGGFRQVPLEMHEKFRGREEAASAIRALWEEIALPLYTDAAV